MAPGDPYGHPISNVSSKRLFVLCVCWAYVWNREIKLSSNPVSNKAIQELHRSGTNGRQGEGRKEGERGASARVQLVNSKNNVTKCCSPDSEFAQREQQFKPIKA
eukprot:scaffold11554_cov101-Skeletonema_marinoi.AAC.2